MTQFQQEMQLLNHYRERLDQNLEVCSCEYCEDTDLTEVRETIFEVNDHWSDVERETI